MHQTEAHRHRPRPLSTNDFRVSRTAAPRRCAPEGRDHRIVEHRQWPPRHPRSVQVQRQRPGPATTGGHVRLGWPRDVRATAGGGNTGRAAAGSTYPPVTGSAHPAAVQAHSDGADTTVVDGRIVYRHGVLEEHDGPDLVGPGGVRRIVVRRAGVRPETAPGRPACLAPRCLAACPARTRCTPSVFELPICRTPAVPPSVAGDGISGGG